MQPSVRPPGLTSHGRSGVSAEEDEVAVDRVLAGDVSAFAGIVARWQTPLINMAYRFCRDRGRAEENLFQRASHADLDARAARQVRVRRGPTPVIATARRFLRAGEGATDHHSV